MSTFSRYATIWFMAKKKYNSKKHRFKNVEDPLHPGDQTPIEHSVVTAVSNSRDKTVSSKPVAFADTRDFSYVTGDLRRIAVMAVVFVGVEIILNYVLLHTALGTAIYQLVKV